MKVLNSFTLIRGFLIKGLYNFLINCLQGTYNHLGSISGSRECKHFGNIGKIQKSFFSKQNEWFEVLLQGLIISFCYLLFSDYHSAISSIFLTKTAPRPPHSFIQLWSFDRNLPHSHLWIHQGRIVRNEIAIVQISHFQPGRTREERSRQAKIVFEVEIM